MIEKELSRIEVLCLDASDLKMSGGLRSAQFANEIESLCRNYRKALETLDYIANSPTRDNKEWSARQTLRDICGGGGE